MPISILQSRVLFILLFCLSVTRVSAEEYLVLSECPVTEGNYISTGNELWLKRGFDQPQEDVSRRRVELSIDCFRKALSKEPNNQNIVFKLIESLYFLGRFISTEQKEKELIFQEALDLSKATLEKIRTISPQANLFTLSLNRQAEILKAIPDSPRALFWASITWGLWGMTFGDFKSAINDVAGKCAYYSELLILVDPKYADGGGYRLLGRLHTIVPRIPLFTFWIDRDKGIELLEQALAISTRDPRNEFFLADALLKYEPQRKEYALEMLYRISKLNVQGEYIVEELETINQAKELLKDIVK